MQNTANTTNGGIGDRFFRMLRTHHERLQLWIEAWQSPLVSMKDILERTSQIVDILGPDLIKMLYPVCNSLLIFATRGRSDCEKDMECVAHIRN